METYINCGTVSKINNRLAYNTITRNQKKFPKVTEPFIYNNVIMDKETLNLGRARACSYSDDIYLLGIKTVWILKKG